MGSIETGERIAALRKIKGWSQSELGEKIGLTQASISEIERGTKRGSVESLESIADALDTDIGYLLTGKEPNKDLPKYYMRGGGAAEGGKKSRSMVHRRRERRGEEKEVTKMRQDEYVNLEKFHAWLKATIRSPHYHGDNEHWERILSDELNKRAGCTVFTEHEFTAPANITISGKDESITIHREDFIAPEDLVEGAQDEDQEWSTRYTF